MERHLHLNNRLKRRAGRQATLVSFREPDGADRFRAQFPDLADKVRVVPPFLDYIAALPFERVVARHARPDRIKLLFVGNDARRKGLPTLVSAIRRLPEAVRARLAVTIVSQFLDGAVDTAGIQATIHSGGRRTVSEALRGNSPVIKQGPLTVQEVMAHMADSHIFAMPTLADTFGFVYLEAMAHGCAVIGPDRSPQTWILDEGRAGMIVDPADEIALAGAIERLVVDDEMRARLAVAGWRRYCNTFAPRVVAAQFRALFEEAIDLHRRRTRSPMHLPVAV